MTVLGIETSCDETGASVVVDGHNLLSNVVLSQIDIHAVYGGVVPEIAARSHLEAVNQVVDQSLSEAKVGWDEIDVIAVTYGAGLAGSLLIGVLTARTLAIVKNKPLYASNHVLGHVYANFITQGPSLATNYPAKQPKLPALALIVSGKHTELVFFKDHFDYLVLGIVQDDAIGEAFDKAAKILGLPYPGGPSIAEQALSGNDHAYQFPKAKLKNKYDFSFSGLKTAVLRTAQQLAGGDHTLPSFEIAKKLNKQQIADISASFQRVAVETVVDKTLLAYQQFQPASVVIAGGVASSQELRRQLSAKIPAELDYAPPALCTDNGAMIACLGCFQVALGSKPVDPYKLGIEPGLRL